MAGLDGITLITESELKSEIVRTALKYWESKRDGHAPPRRETFDPLEVPYLLPHLILKEVRRHPLDFRYRVVGTVVREHSRGNFTGKCMSEVEGQGPDSIVFRVSRWVCDERRVAIFRPPYVGPHKQFKRCEAAITPWVDGEGLVDRILIAVDFMTT